MQRNLRNLTYLTDLEKRQFQSELPTCINTIFQDTVNKLYKNHITIFTDGSKSSNQPSVGAACIISQYNLTLTTSITKLASVYTVECLAVELTTDYANKDPTKSYLICTDSLSLVHSLKAASFHSNSNRHIANIKKGLQHFRAISTDSNIAIMWIPKDRIYTPNSRTQPSSIHRLHTSN